MSTGTVENRPRKSTIRTPWSCRPSAPKRTHSPCSRAECRGRHRRILAKPRPEGQEFSGEQLNLPRQPATPEVGATGHSRTLETTNYKTSRTVTNMKIERGELKRLSVAVLVDQVIEWDEVARKLVRRPRQNEEMASLRELVVAAAGIDEQRGDTLTIENLPFTIFEPAVEPPPEPEEEPSVVWLDWIKDNRYNLVAGGVVTLVLAVAFLWWNRRRSKRKALRAKKEAELLQRAEQSESGAVPPRIGSRRRGEELERSRRSQVTTGLEEYDAGYKSGTGTKETLRGDGSERPRCLCSTASLVDP